MENFTIMNFLNRVFIKATRLGKSPMYLLLFLCIMNASKSYAFSSSYAVYAVSDASTPIGTTTYCPGATTSSYSCTDIETSCSNSYSGNTNTITYQWYYDSGTPISGPSATGTFVASGSGTTVTLSAADAAVLTTLSVGTHTLYCTFTPDVSNCYYYAYAPIASPSLSITIAGISGPSSVCAGSTVTLSVAGSGGTWTTDNAPVATVSSSGTVTGVSVGTANISYVGGGCSLGQAISVTAPLTPITGSTSLCAGGTTTLSNSTAGGTWSSSNNAIATVSSTGVVSGVSGGTVTITYTVGGCSTSISVTVAGAITPITGPSTVCPGSTISLTDATAGGTWSSDNAAVATVSGTGVVTGVSGGTANIIYTVGLCTISKAITVVTVAPITGTAAVCPGGNTPLNDATPGGVWSSASVGVATVSASGVVYGVSNGTSVISYTVSGCAAVTTVTVSVLPAITGPTSVCVGSTITESNAVPSGVWSSANNSVATVDPTTGVVTGVSSGSASIIYTVGTCSVNVLVTVGAAVSAITGPSVVCVGSTITMLNSTPGGSWSSSAPTVASISNTGVVTGVSAGNATISYAFGACVVTTTVTVDAPGAGTITGKDSLCKGTGHEITLSSSVSGGVWSSTNTARATVDPSTGVVTGAFSSSTVVKDTIRYTVTNSCGTYTAMKVIYLRTTGKCNVGTSLEESVTPELSIFPNPNSGTFTMTLASDVNEEVQVVISDVTGRKVKEFTTASNKLVDVKLSPVAGIYILTATTPRSTYTSKVVVDK